MTQEILLRVNGVSHRLSLSPDRTLLSVLRHELAMTGTKYGCGKGLCGACTVLVDGRARRACTLRVDRIADRQITTIEGLEKDGELHPLQVAFAEEGALQCGYCTPGMIMNAAELVAEGKPRSRDEIIRHMEGNLCRCGTHIRILRAIEKATAVVGGAQ